MKWLPLGLVVCSLLVLPCQAFYGVEVSPNVAQAAVLTNAATKLSLVAQQVLSVVNGVKDLSYTTLTTQRAASAFVATVTQTYTQLGLIATTISSATNANSGNLDTLFNNLQAVLTPFGSETLTTRYGPWLQLVELTNAPDLLAIQYALADLGTFYSTVLGPRMKQFMATRISQTTFYASVPKTMIDPVLQQLTTAAQMEETGTLPFLRNVASGFKMASEQQATFLNNVNDAFQYLDYSLSSLYTGFQQLTSQFQTAANERQSSIRTTVDQFNTRVATFTDLYLGGSAADYVAAASAMYDTYTSNATALTQTVVSRLESVRNNFTENPLVSIGQALNLGFTAVGESLDKALRKTTSATATNCIKSALNNFQTSFSSFLRNAFPGCVSSIDYDVRTPVTVQSGVVKNIQSDVLQYFKQLSDELNGLSDASPQSARIAADTFLTAYFSQSLGIITTILQQLVNVSTKLTVDYNLLIGRSRYCLAANVAAARMMAMNLGIATDMCG